MKIGGLSITTGVPIDTIRHCERESLLPEPARSKSNNRHHSAEHGQRLSFIRHCRGRDMTLDEIRVLLRFKNAPSADCGEVNALLDEHIGHGAQRVRELCGRCRSSCASCATPAAACGALSIAAS